MSAYKVEIYRPATGTSQSPGGQHAGSPRSGVRVTHVETGISAMCAEARSQHKNREVAHQMVEWGLVSLGYDVPKE